ncbi:MAG: site-specific integrase [Bacteroidetes bacterium]|nr:site-specific integrase [Bacteroidota bacterium]
MATVRILQDKRRKNKDEKYPLMLRVYHGDVYRNISLKIMLEEKDWDLSSAKVRSRYPNSNRLNLNIQKKIGLATKTLIDKEFELPGMSVDELKDEILTAIYGGEKSILRANQNTLQSYGQNLVDRFIKAKRIGNADTYTCMLNSIGAYRNDQDIDLSKITIKFLNDYEADCLQRGLKVNTISIYLRTLRALMNKAIDEGHLSSTHYPFRKFSIKTERTEKRAISKPELRVLLNVELKPDSNMWHSRNYFGFMFYMRGMNFIDLAYLKWENIQNNRIVYRRLKTGKVYNIKIPFEAQLVLDLYNEGNSKDNNRFVFPIIPAEVQGDVILERTRFRNRRKYFNKDLKEIAHLCKIDVNLTSYVTRHTWATLAKYAGVSTAIIGESLGHSDVKVTEGYLADFEQEVLDDANEKVLTGIT